MLAGKGGIVNVLEEIKSGTCPYCGARYSIDTRGCEAKCPVSQDVAAMISELLDEGEYTEEDEVEGR